MARVYDLRTVVCTIAGVALNGYGEDDAISFEWTEEIASRKASGDGQITYSRLNNRELVATVTLMATSKVIPLLMAAIEAQHGDNTGIPIPLLAPMPFLLTDPILGDLVSGECVFITRPAPSKSREVSEIEFQVSLPSPKIGLGAANLI
jgi:hypothetical protein